tara:strand:+ start:107 stop:274 length:168 start_codon:yes stop_codon:yes gene_type:complete
MDIGESLEGHKESQENKISNENSTEMWQSPLSQGTYLFFWAIASIASFAIFFRFF